MDKVLRFTREEIATQFAKGKHARKVVWSSLSDGVFVYFDEIHSEQYSMRDIISLLTESCKKHGYFLEVV